MNWLCCSNSGSRAFPIVTLTRTAVSSGTTRALTQTLISSESDLLPWEAAAHLIYLTPLAFHGVHCLLNCRVWRFREFHLSLHILLKIGTNQEIVFTPFICRGFGFCLDHSVNASHCKRRSQRTKIRKGHRPQISVLSSNQPTCGSDTLLVKSLHICRF